MARPRNRLKSASKPADIPSEHEAALMKLPISDVFDTTTIPDDSASSSSSLALASILPPKQALPPTPRPPRWRSSRNMNPTIISLDRRRPAPPVIVTVPLVGGGWFVMQPGGATLTAATSAGASISVSPGSDVASETHVDRAVAVEVVSAEAKSGLGALRDPALESALDEKATVNALLRVEEAIREAINGDIRSKEDSRILSAVPLESLDQTDVAGKQESSSVNLESDSADPNFDAESDSIDPNFGDPVPAKTSLDTRDSDASKQVRPEEPISVAGSSETTSLSEPEGTDLQEQIANDNVTKDHATVLEEPLALDIVDTASIYNPQQLRPLSVTTEEISQAVFVQSNGSTANTAAPAAESDSVAADADSATVPASATTFFVIEDQTPESPVPETQLHAISKSTAQPAIASAPVAVKPSNVIPPLFFRRQASGVEKRQRCQEILNACRHFFLAEGSVPLDDSQLLAVSVTTDTSGNSMAVVTSAPAASRALFILSSFLRHYPDLDAMVYHMIATDASIGIVPSDFEIILRDILENHPAFDFLNGSDAFQARFTETVITRLFYLNPRIGKITMTLREFRKLNLLNMLNEVDQAPSCLGASMPSPFSYKDFYVIYCKFWELDRDRDMLVNATDLEMYGRRALSRAAISRVIECHGGSDDHPGCLDFKEFVTFILSVEDKTTDSALDYWFRVLDLDEDGVLSLLELETFWEHQQHRLPEHYRIEDFFSLAVTVFDRPATSFRLDLVRPGSTALTMMDLKRSRASAGLLLDMIVDSRRHVENVRRATDGAFRFRDEVWLELDDSGPGASQGDPFAVDEPPFEPQAPRRQRLEGWGKFSERSYRELANPGPAASSGGAYGNGGGGEIDEEAGDGADNAGAALGDVDMVDAAATWANGQEAEDGDEEAGGPPEDQYDDGPSAPVDDEAPAVGIAPDALAAEDDVFEGDSEEEEEDDEVEVDDEGDATEASGSP
ncbi:Serine/threonine-protein phosphatase 2A regulatory subunit B'' subunit alpha, partial [Cladochytrium tenue]